MKSSPDNVKYYVQYHISILLYHFILHFTPLLYMTCNVLFFVPDMKMIANVHSVERGRHVNSIINVRCTLIVRQVTLQIAIFVRTYNTIKEGSRSVNAFESRHCFVC